MKIDFIFIYNNIKITNYKIIWLLNENFDSQKSERLIH